LLVFHPAAHPLLCSGWAVVFLDGYGGGVPFRVRRTGWGAIQSWSAIARLRSRIARVRSPIRATPSSCR